jgi:hypothetical protein
MAEGLAAAALALALGAFVLAAFAWKRAGGTLRSPLLPARPAGNAPREPSPGPTPPRAPAAGAPATDPLVLLRLDALERRLDSEAQRAEAQGAEPARAAPSRGEAARGGASSTPGPGAARVAPWRAFP